MNLSALIFIIVSLVSLLYLCHATDTNTNGFPGTVELIENNYRKSRVNRDFGSDTNSPSNPIQYHRSADRSSRKRHNSKTNSQYDQLLQIDTKNLSEQQKDLLERIVERVARLGGSAMLDEISQINQNSSTSVKPATVSDQVETTTLNTSTTEFLNEGRAKTTNSNNKKKQSNKSTSHATRRPSSTQSVHHSTHHSSSVSSSHPAPSTISVSSTIPVSASTATVSSSGGPKRTTVHPKTESTKKTQYQKINTPIAVGTVKRPIELQSNGTQSNADPSDLSSSLQTPLDLSYDTGLNTSSIVDSLSKDTNPREDIYLTKRPGNDATSNNSNIKIKNPSGKPTKYHYYPHNQHIYLLPECAIQQVCNAIYVRLNHTQPLCACPSRYRDPCSASLNEDDLHTTKLIGDGNRKAVTLAKTCESTTEMRECRAPKDWSLLALQNIRTGKSHYLVICRCPDHYKLEGPMAHDQPTYASVPGIRVFGMMCVQPGVTIKRPQPTKQHYFQKPYQPAAFYNSNKYHSTVQPTTQQYQSPGNYQYLNRHEAIGSTVSSINSPYHETVTINSFGYGRQNSVDPEIYAETDPSSTTSAATVAVSTSSAAASSSSSSATNDNVGGSSSTIDISQETSTSRIKRDLTYTSEQDDPPFPWHLVQNLNADAYWQ